MNITAYGFNTNVVNITRPINLLRCHPKLHEQYQEYLKQNRLTEDSETCILFMDSLIQENEDGDGFWALFPDMNTGFWKLFAYTIEREENVKFTYESEDGIFLLQISYPWEYTETMRNITLEEVKHVLTKWLSLVTDDTVTFEEFNLMDGPTEIEFTANSTRIV